MSFFAGAQGTVVNGYVTMTANTGPTPSDCGFNILFQHATPSALYASATLESTKDPGCLHGTRSDVQDHIFKWMDDPEGEVAMWMYGPAGIGKTAIAQTVARLCGEKNQLLSAFFFFRSDDGRNSAKHLVATLAFEMVQQMPHTRDIICAPIANNPLVFSAALERQIRTIILPALSMPLPASQNAPCGAMLLIIDGLDECTDTRTQQLIIQSFISLLAMTKTSTRHKVLIVSRPESHIVSTFSTISVSQHVRHLCLDEWNTIADIKVFLRAELEEVKQTHPLKSYLDANWPSDDSFERLLDKSFESFAYATSAIRYISSHDRNPATSLNDLLSLSPGCAFEAYAELDLLYRHILNSLNEKTRHIVLQTLCLRTWNLQPPDIINIFGSILGEEQSVIELALIKMSSVIRVQGTWFFAYYHTSLRDFLEDEARSGPLYLYSPRVSTAVAKALLSRLSWVGSVAFQSPDYNLLDAIVTMLLKMRTIAVDFQVHILNTFLATHLPTILLGAPNHFRPGFFASINRGCQSEEDGTISSLTLLYRQAFDYIAAWLRSQVGAGIRSSETILNICFIPALMPLSRNTISPDLSATIFNLVRRSKDPWWTIPRLLPEDESWKICIMLVEIYSAMPQEARAEDMMQDYEFVNGRSEPAGQEICHMLEEIVAGAMAASAEQMSPRNLICFHLSQDTSESTNVPKTQETNLKYTYIAEAMDLYIRKTHSELDLPYISEGVRGLYCDMFDWVLPVPRYRKQKMGRRR